MKEMLIHLTFESELTYLPILRTVVRGVSSHKITNEQHLEEIELSVHEALSNVICHAYDSEPDHEVKLSIGLSDEDVIIQICDRGHSPSLPLTPPLADAAIFDLESIPESGRGLYFIHQLMDEVSYSTLHGENIIRLRKHVY